jgi:hypothetical protein
MNDGALAYMIGRNATKYPCSEDPMVDLLFAGQRLDGMTISDRKFQHCTFSNISFKDVELNHTEFLDCTFIGCYFRKSKIQNCIFPGSKFISCQFPKISVQACNFSYVSFENCVMPFAEMEFNLPSEPNLGQELSSNLAHAAETLGLTKEACDYKLYSIKANETHLWAAVCSRTTWYQTHYPGINRFFAFIKYLSSKINGLLWGHGERLGIVLRNFVVLTFLIIPFFLWLSRSGISTPGKTEPNFFDLEGLSVSTILAVSGISDLVATSEWARVILLAEKFCGLILAGLFITILFRTIVRR